MGIFNKKTKEQLAGIVKVTFPDGVVPSVTPSKAKPLTTGRPGGSNGSNGGSKTGGTPTSTQQPYSWLDNYIEQNKPRTKEQEEADRRRAERNERLARIGDVMTAMHQAYSHARGVQPMPSSGNLSEKMRARYDKLEADRRQRDQWWVNAKQKHEEFEDRLRQQKELAALRGQQREEASKAQAAYYAAKTAGEEAKAQMFLDAYNMIAANGGLTMDRALELLGFKPDHTTTQKQSVNSKGEQTWSTSEQVKSYFPGSGGQPQVSTPPVTNGGGSSSHSSSKGKGKGHSTNSSNSSNRGSSGSKGKGNGYSTNSTHSNNRGY